MTHENRAELLATFLEISVDDVYDRALASLAAEVKLGYGTERGRILDVVIDAVPCRRQRRRKGTTRKKTPAAKRKNKISFRKCQHCKAAIAAVGIHKHIPACKKRTPAERKQWKEDRSL